MRSIWRIWALALLALAVQSWATCTTRNTYMYATGNATCSDGLCIQDAIDYYDDYRCDGGYLQAPRNSCGNGTAVRVNYACRGGANAPYLAKAVYTHCQGFGQFLYYDRTICTTKCEADSAAHYSSCVSQANHFWDSDSCKCRQRTEADSTFTICTEDVRNGNVYSSIYSVTCHYSNGTATQCCGVTPNSIYGEGYKSVCPMVRQERGTCGQNGVPNGPSPPSNGTVPMLPTAQCYAVVGYTCYMRDYASGRTYSCECDGNCTVASMRLVSGYGCSNPYPQPPPSSPSSSDSGGGSSSPSSSDSGGGSSSPSSSDSGSSSPSSSPSSGTSGNYTEQLNQLIANTLGIMENAQDISQWTQQTMNNTTDLKNEVSNVGVDVGHIRDNTQQTANNTGSIDSKLSTTNSLLESLNNKEWSPNIEVAGDTNIINVNVGGDTNIINVSTDTSKAPAEIKGIMETFKGAFDDFVSTFNGIFNGDDPYDATDTAGTGTRETGVIDSINAKVGGDTVPNMLDSIPKAITGVRGSLGALRDSLNGSAYGDSMNVWTDKLLNNGVLSGTGSNNCPQFLTRNFSWNMGPLGTWNLGSFRYICEPIAGVNITLWALARMVLRAMVAITCMLWLYRVVVGIDGGNNEEN